MDDSHLCKRRLQRTFESCRIVTQNHCKLLRRCPRVRHALRNHSSRQTSRRFSMKQIVRWRRPWRAFGPFLLVTLLLPRTEVHLLDLTPEWSWTPFGSFRTVCPLTLFDSCLTALGLNCWSSFGPLPVYTSILVCFMSFKFNAFCTDL